MTKINNIKAGHLSEAMTAEQWNNITAVQVSGNINFTDWQFLGTLAQNKLEDIDLGNTSGLRMTADLNHIFYGSKSLKKLILPEGVTLIDEKCFEDCNQLESIKLPNSLNNIGGYAFLRCGLKEIVMQTS